jgi:hypothetical protein
LLSPDLRLRLRLATNSISGKRIRVHLDTLGG